MEIIREALFGAGTEDYRVPIEPDPGENVTIRFRTGKDNGDRVYCIGRERIWEMDRSWTENRFDYYECTIPVGDAPIFYHFKIEKGQDVCFYNRLGPAEEDGDQFDFRITPGFHTPQWAKGAVMYQIFVDRFCNGDPENDPLSNEYVYIGRPVVRVEDWEKPPNIMDVGCFHGGDLQGVWNKLDYLKSLGIEAIYFNPIFVSPSNHKYDCQDYEHIDPHFGVIPNDGGALLNDGDWDNRNAERYIRRTASPENLQASDDFFARFVEAAHARGIKVILDGVFNHCGSFNKWLDGEEIYDRAGGYEPGAYMSKDSPYRSFFRFRDNRDEAWPYNGSYEGWWGHDTLPELNYENSEKLVEYILNVARRWISPPFCVDGWRLDVAADLGVTQEYNHQFWRQFRQAVKEVNPEVLILAEHYGDPSSWLEGDQWDTVMNYDAFMEPVTWFLTGMEKHSDSKNEALKGDGPAFFSSMAYHMSRMQENSIFTAMNELSNHDHSRFLTRTNGVVGRIANLGAEAAEQGVQVSVLRQAVLIQMTWPGAPTIYYGDEAGVCGWTDPDCRRTYPWGREDLELLEYHRYAIGLHRKLMVLKWGALKPLLAGKDYIVYGRMLGKYVAVTAVSTSSEECCLQIPVWQLGVTDEMLLTRILLTESSYYNVGRVSSYPESGNLNIKLPPQGGALYINDAEKFFSVVIPGANPINKSV